MTRRRELEQAGLCILVVEDNPGHKAIIMDAIKESNALNKILCLENGIEALRYLQREGKYQDRIKFPIPDLMLLDLKLPGMHGKDVLRNIKTSKEIPVIPVIVLTASSQDRDIDECYKLGARGYITKPMHEHEFAEVIKAFPHYWTTVNKPPRNLYQPCGGGW